MGHKGAQGSWDVQCSWENHMRFSGDWRSPEDGCTWTASGDLDPWGRELSEKQWHCFHVFKAISTSWLYCLQVLYLTVRKHIFSLGNSRGPSTPSSCPSVSKYTSRQTHRRKIWLVRSWCPGRGPCSSFLNTFTSLSMALQREKRRVC